MSWKCRRIWKVSLQWGKCPVRIPHKILCPRRQSKVHFRENTRRPPWNMNLSRQVSVSNLARSAQYIERALQWVHEAFRTDSPPNRSALTALHLVANHSAKAKNSFSTGDKKENSGFTCRIEPKSPPAASHFRQGLLVFSLRQTLPSSHNMVYIVVSCRPVTTKASADQMMTFKTLHSQNKWYKPYCGFDGEEFTSYPWLYLHWSFSNVLLAQYKLQRRGAILSKKIEDYHTSLLLWIAIHFASEIHAVAMECMWGCVESAMYHREQQMSTCQKDSLPLTCRVIPHNQKHSSLAGGS